MQARMITGFSGTKDFDQSSLFASQAVENIRTVASLGQLGYFFASYAQVLDAATDVRFV